MKLSDIEGFEYDWLACDEAGNVALLTTAGRGYAPQVFLAAVDAYEAAIDGLLAMPIASRVESAPVLRNGLVNTWRDAVERGAYAFDVEHHDGLYSRVGVPETPTSISHLPSAVAEVVGRFRFRGLLFRDAVSISRADIEGSEGPSGSS